MYPDALNVETDVTVGVAVTLVDGVVISVTDDVIVGVVVSVAGDIVSVVAAVLTVFMVADVPGVVVPAPAPAPVTVTLGVVVAVAFVDGVVAQPATRARTNTSAAIVASLL